MNGNFSSARLIQYSYFHSVTKAGGSVAEDDLYVLNEAVVLDIVVCNIVLDVLDATIVADGDIVQGGVEDTGMLMHAASHFEALQEAAQTDLAGEACASNVFQTDFVGDIDGAPIIGRTTLFLQLANLICAQLPDHFGFHIFVL